MIDSMEDRDGWIWFDGDLVPWRDARCHVLSHTLHHGLGVFEGVRAYCGPSGTAVFRLDDHVQRFFESAHIMKMPLPIDPARLAAAHLEVVRANRLDRCYLRPLAYFGGDRMGVSARGNRVHVCVAAWSWEDYLGENAQQQGVRVGVSSYCRIHHNSLLTKAKVCGHYVNSMLAQHDAKDLGYHDALLLDVHGFVAEASTSNVFIVSNGVIVTPPKTSVLDGITRRTIITLAEEAGYPVAERHLTRDEVYCAQEMWMTGTASEVTPVIEVDGRRIGDGHPGPVTRELQRAYAATVRGENPAHHDWLSPL